MKRIVKEFLSFLKEPTELIRGKGYKVTSDIAGLLTLDLVLAMLTLPLAQLLEAFNLINFQNHDLSNLLEGDSFVFTLLLMAVIVPIIEEFVFRLPLRMKYNIIPMSRLISARKLSDADEALKIYQVKKSWLQNYGYVYYGMAILFAIVHLTNYPLTLNVILFSFILCLPQFLMALIVSYARLKHGLWSSMLLHGLHNLVFGLLAFYSM